MTDITVSRELLRHTIDAMIGVFNGASIEAADRIEQLERENEANERNLRQLTDDLAASRRENAELRKELQAELQRRVWAEIQSQYRDHSPLSMTVAFDNAGDKPPQVGLD